MSRFQRRLQKQILFYSAIIVLLAMALFSLYLYYYTRQVSSQSLSDNGEAICEDFDEIQEIYQKHMLLFTTKGRYVRFLQSRDTALAEELLRSFNEEEAVPSDLIISDVQHKICFSSMTAADLDERTLAFNQQINEAPMEDYEVRSDVNWLTNGYGRLVMTTPIYRYEELIGYATYYWDMASFNSLLQKNKVDYVIYDAQRHVVAATDIAFCGHEGPYYISREQVDTTVTQEGSVYQSMEFTLGDSSFYVCVFQPYIDMSDLLVAGNIVILLGGGFLLLLIFLYAKRISRATANSISLLGAEMKHIKEGDLEHRIVLHTQDEFEDVAEEINDLVVQVKELTDRNALLKYENTISELKLLEAQFDPHFLYNTLETIRYAAILNPKTADQLILNLTKILRYSISNKKDEQYLREDLKYIEMYLEIEKCRFGEHFNYDIRIEEACMEIIVPRLFLQPLIENSIRYGFQSKTDLHIYVHGSIEQGELQIIVEDDGEGIAEEEVSWLNDMIHQKYNDSEHHGLFNVARRLQLMFGDRVWISIHSRKRIGTIVQIRIRLEEVETC